MVEDYSSQPLTFMEVHVKGWEIEASNSHASSFKPWLHVDKEFSSRRLKDANWK